jgi:hypothetical protein
MAASCTAPCGAGDNADANTMDAASVRCHCRCRCLGRGWRGADGRYEARQSGYREHVPQHLDLIAAAAVTISLPPKPDKSG